MRPIHEMQYTSLNLRRLMKPNHLELKSLSGKISRMRKKLRDHRDLVDSTAALPRKITKVKKGAKWFTGYDGAPGQ